MNVYHFLLKLLYRNKTEILFSGAPVITGVNVDWLSEREVVAISSSVIGFPEPDLNFFKGQQLIDPNSPPDGHRVTDSKEISQ